MPRRPPDIDGTAGHAWLVPRLRQEQWARRVGREAGLASSVEMWYVNGDNFHPFWKWWLVSVISLADLPGLAPAHKEYPLAEYELAIWSLDPDKGEPPVNGDGPFHPLHPQDVCFHFHGLTVGEAKGLVRVAVEAIVAGRISPDSDFRKMWQEILVRLVNDYRLGTFGGRRRKRLALDPYTHRFTGEEVDE